MFGPEFLQQLSALKSATDSGMSRLPELIVEGKVRLRHGTTWLSLMEKDDLEDFLAIALQNAVEQVTALREKELMQSMANLIPNPENP